MKRHYPASRKFAPGFLPRFSNGIVRHISAAAAVVLLSFHAAAVEFRWVASAQDIAPVDRAIYQGETLDLTATMTSYGRPVVFPDGAVATFLWRPLGADAPYFDKPASVEINGSRLMARFTPDDDIGESAYEFFIRAQVDSSVNYRANGIIRTLDSPGFSPGTLTPPIPYLDFAAVAYTNAPWLLASDLPEPPDLSTSPPPTPSQDWRRRSEARCPPPRRTSARSSGIPPPPTTPPPTRSQWRRARRRYRT